MTKTVGGEEALRKVKPGSPEALALLKYLVHEKGPPLLTFCNCSSILLTFHL